MSSIATVVAYIGSNTVELNNPLDMTVRIAIHISNTTGDMSVELNFLTEADIAIMCGNHSSIPIRSKMYINHYRVLSHYSTATECQCSNRSEVDIVGVVTVSIQSLSNLILR